MRAEPSSRTYSLFDLTSRLSDAPVSLMLPRLPNRRAV